MEQQIGPEAVASLDLVDGKVIGSVKYNGADASAKLEIEFNAKPLAEKLAAKLKEQIPGQLDDLVIDAAVAAVFK